MTTTTTGTQGPQIRMIVLIGIAIATIGAAAMIAINRPTTTSESTQQATTQADAAANAALLDGINRQAAALDEAVAAGGRPGYVATSAGATDRVAPLPDSIADAQDRAMADARIADREAAAVAAGGAVADAFLGDANAALEDGIHRRAEAYEQALNTGAIPGWVAPARVAPLPDSIADAQDRAMADARIADREAAAEAAGGAVANAVLGDANAALEDGIHRRAEAYEQALNTGAIPGWVAPARVAPLPDSVADAQDRAMAAERIADREAAAVSEDINYFEYFNGSPEDSDRAEPVKDWKWPMPNDQIL